MKDWIRIAVMLLLIELLTGCAASPLRAHPVEIQCGPSNYEKCADKCALQGRGAPFIVENATDVACFCRKSPEGA